MKDLSPLKSFTIATSFSKEQQWLVRNLWYKVDWKIVVHIFREYVSNILIIGIQCLCIIQVDQWREGKKIGAEKSAAVIFN